MLLRVTDAYTFYSLPRKDKRGVKACCRYSVQRYLLRYLMAHKNYLLNTAAMWGVACILPLLFGRMESRFILPVGFAILSLNTPLCILLSCDPALERVVRFLPGQQKAFCIPYCLFLFLCNITADTIFLCSWQIQTGGITGIAVFAAALFALLSASGSVRFGDGKSKATSVTIQENMLCRALCSFWQGLPAYFADQISGKNSPVPIPCHFCATKCAFTCGNMRE